MSDEKNMYLQNLAIGELEHKPLNFDFLFSSHRCSDEKNILQDLSMINIFVGQNNSGKSRLLRRLFHFDKCSYTTSNNTKKLIDETLAIYSQKFKDKFKEKGLLTFGDMEDNFIDNVIETMGSDNNNNDYVVNMPDIFKRISGAIDILNSNIKKNSYSMHGGYSLQEIERRRVKTSFIVFYEELKSATEKISDSYTKAYSLESRIHYYIPMLRGLRLSVGKDNVSNDIYHHRTISDYFHDKDKNILPNNRAIYTGLDFFKSLTDKLLNEPEDRELIKDYEQFIGDTFFNGKDISLIPKTGSNVVHIRVGKEPLLPIYSLGDGIQHLLILTYHIYTEKNPALFFMEEPDLSMHPGMQRTFLEVLKSHPQHQYFITTHSNHLLDMTLDFSDISVYMFKKEILEKDDKEHTNFQITLASSNDNRLLDELGVQNSSVFLTNATIWVEGITDRRYLRAYMKKYIETELTKEEQKQYNKLREDYHYSFVEYQGAGLPHWSFDETEDMEKIKAFKLCGHPFLLTDGDIPTDRAELYKEMLEDKSFYKLPGKEIENLIPETILPKAIEEVFKTHTVDLTKIKYAKYVTRKTGIGAYLDSFRKKGDKKTFADKYKTGTIRYKNKLSISVAKHLEEDKNLTLPSEVKKLCKAIFEHLLEHNDV